VRLTPAEDRLQAAEELDTSACLLRRLGAGRQVRATQSRHRARNPAGQASQRKETCRPHGAQSYQTPRRAAAVLTNPLDPILSSPPMPAPPASATTAGIAIEREEVIMARVAGRTSSRSGEGRNRTGDTTVFSRVLYQLSYLARRPAV
jgi:hypothetical protein